ncbi:MAG: D-arabinono-1,4-lactone oxidase [Haloarculaceae archaeon]
MPRWENWSGRVACEPTAIERPETEAELVSLVETHAPESTIRVAGAGHSFTDVVPTDDVLVSLENYAGVESVDPERGRATVRAGTVLADAGRELAAHGLAMENLGDIDRQTVAGALATGTHGTGTDFGVLATQVTAVRLVTADGRVRTLEPGDEAFGPAQVSLGALGVVSAVTLDCQPSYELSMVARERPVDEVFADLDAYKSENRHFEFFWYPGDDLARVKTINRTDEPAPPLRGGEVVERQTGPSHEVFPSVRDVRFNEMEYGLPAAHGEAAFRRARSALESHGGISFPIEFRCVAADDVPLSPAYGRETTFVAVHRYHERPYRAFFDRCEAVFDEYEGRPHWGKLHTQTAADLAPRYPEWDRFQAVRRDLDPHGVFLNDHLRDLFGAAAAGAD